MGWKEGSRRPRLDATESYSVETGYRVKVYTSPLPQPDTEPPEDAPSEPPMPPQEVVRHAPERPSWSAWLLWFLANMAATLVVVSLTYGSNLLVNPALGTLGLDRPNWGRIAYDTFMGIITGSIYGVAQWLVLRRYLAGLTWKVWVFATVLGGLAYALLDFLFAQPLVFALNILVFSGQNSSDYSLWAIAASQVVTRGLFGVVVSWAQWRVLRRYVHHSAWWIVSGVAAALIGSAIDQIALQITLDAGNVDVLLLFLSYTLISSPIIFGLRGLAIVYLLKRPIQEAASVDDVSATSFPRKALTQRTWKILFATSVVLGSLIWFFALTDYSLAGTFSDIIFPPIAAIVGITAFIAARHAPHRKLRIVYRSACLPAIVGGALPIIVAGLMFQPPATLGVMFNLYEIRDEKMVQQVTSPDGLRIADVYFRGVGSYAGGSGKIVVRVKHTLFPLIERDIYATTVYESGDSVRDYLEWRDNDILYIREGAENAHVGSIRLESPEWWRQATLILKGWSGDEMDR